ncbi:hypothetical protein AMTRI_Chr13g121740 [Amborella trichopoda]
MDSVLNFPKEPYIKPKNSIKTHLHIMVMISKQKRCHSYKLLIKHLYFYSLKEKIWNSINLNSGYM